MNGRLREQTLLVLWAHNIPFRTFRQREMRLLCLNARASQLNGCAAITQIRQLNAGEREHNVAIMIT